MPILVKERRIPTAIPRFSLSLCEVKRLLIIALVFWYAVMATGFHVHIHYCCGKLASIAINQVEGEEDACCGHSDSCSVKKKCCSSDDVYMALEEEHERSNFDLKLFSFTSSDTANHSDPYNSENTALEQIVQGNPANGPPLYLLYHQSLFYG